MVRKLKTPVCPRCFGVGELKERYVVYRCGCGNTWLVNSKKKVIQSDGVDSES